MFWVVGCAARTGQLCALEMQLAITCSSLLKPRLQCHLSDATPEVNLIATTSTTPCAWIHQPVPCFCLRTANQTMKGAVYFAPFLFLRFAFFGLSSRASATAIPRSSGYLCNPLCHESSTVEVTLSLHARHGPRWPKIFFEARPLVSQNI